MLRHVLVADRSDSRSKHAVAAVIGQDGVLAHALQGQEHVKMMDGDLKQDILRALSELVEHTPELRFGQLIANLAVIARGPTPEAVWDMEDDELLEAIKSHIEDYERRHAGVV